LPGRASSSPKGLKTSPRWAVIGSAGSLKRGHVTASLLIGKLQANPRRNALTRALQEYGRVAKTLFVLRYLGSEAYRRRIGVQLNKGEALHALRRFLFFAHQGQVRRGQPEDQANQASCLNLVTNAVIAWNTVYMAAVIDRLKAKGEQISPEQLAHLSPARHDHINPYGHYQFRVDRWAGKKPLRPIKGQVPQPPEQLKRHSMATATTSETDIPGTCSIKSVEAVTVGESRMTHVQSGTER
jgi:hypothetical protein